MGESFAGPQETPDDPGVRDDERARLLSAVSDAVDQALRSGMGWAEVAAALGVTADEARARFGPTTAPGTPAPGTTDPHIPDARSEGNDPGPEVRGVEPAAGTTSHSAEGAAGGAAGTAAGGAAQGAAAGGATQPESTHRLGPVTLFTEMGALERAGRRGWRVVGSGTAYHVVAKTQVQWEFRRVFASRSTGRALLADGWQRIGTGWFPWGYYQRATGEPAEPDEVVAGYAVEP